MTAPAWRRLETAGMMWKCSNMPGCRLPWETAVTKQKMLPILS